MSEVMNVFVGSGQVPDRLVASYEGEEGQVLKSSWLCESTPAFSLYLIFSVMKEPIGLGGSVLTC